MQEVVSKELDYKQFDKTHPTYILTKVLPQSGNNQWAIRAAGQEILLQLPVTAYNLAKSILYFQIFVSDTAVNPIGDNLQQWWTADCLSAIQQIELYDTKNTPIARIYDLQNYTSMVWKSEIKQSDFLTFDQAVNCAPNVAAIPNVTNNCGFTRFLQPSFINLPGLSNHRFDNTLPQLTGYKPTHFFSTTVMSNSVNAGSFGLNVMIPLSMFSNTIFSVDKDLLFNEVMTIRIILNGTS